MLEARESRGHCYVTSVYDWKVPHSGTFNEHLVPLKGATVDALSGAELRSIHPGTCRLDVVDEKSVLARQLMAFV